MTETATTTYRSPEVGDGAAIHGLIAQSPPLDLNSPYCYLLMCSYFSDSSMVAEQDGRPVGFLGGFRVPSAPDVLFVWQVVVASDCRKQGIAGELLEQLLLRPLNHDVRWLEATVAPSNMASRRFFQAFAERWQLRTDEQPGFLAEDLQAAPGHEAEPVLRIGPIIQLKD